MLRARAEGLQLTWMDAKVNVLWFCALRSMAGFAELLRPAQARRLLELCGQRLPTPVGLRSLDPADARYQGTVWAWWLGPWAIAQARVQGDPKPALRWLEGSGEQLAEAGLGSISEIFDGAELLRAWTELAGEGDKPPGA